MGTYLDRILDAHRTADRADPRPLERLLEAARLAPPCRPFSAALQRRHRLSVIAEVKRRSPSKGHLADVRPAELAAAYEHGGASAISVLTDTDFFGGSPADLAEAREAVAVPVLRKDFTVGPRDVCDARLMGADALLLIVAALDDAELRDLAGLARELAIEALVEVHDEAELERALAAGAEVVGVNQRDLVTFEVDRARAVRVARRIPGSVVRVAESGVRDATDARELAAAGYDAVLVGESLVTAPDPGAAVSALLVPRG